MALTLSLSYEERNDNKEIIITDTTSNWGVGGNIAVTDITALTLDIEITISSGTKTEYDQINLYVLGDGPFANQAEMVFKINASMLLVSGAAMGTADTELPDGIWGITYIVNTTAGTLQEDILVDGRVRVAVYELLRILPTIYNCSECRSKVILDAIYCYGCLNVLRSDAYAAKTEELINLLYVIERLVTNGSNYTW